MNIKVVEFICEENMAAPGTSPTPRPAGRPRPSLADLKTSGSSVQSFEDATDESSPAQPTNIHDVTN